MKMTSAAFALVALLGQLPSRESARPPTGSALIAGIVQTDDNEHRPLRRVRVGITSADRETNRAVITDDAGRFAFTGLAAGRYSLQAFKAGYVSTSYGATRPMRPGTPIVLADGQRASGLTLRMPQGAVITGTIVDQNGEPAVGISVSTMRRATVNGAPQLTYSTGARGETDDRGTYRIYDLAAGDYIVAATPSISLSSGESIRLTTDADVREAFAQVKSDGAASAPGADADAVPTVGFAPVFYPGTTSSAQAGVVTVSASQERGGVDFQLQLVATAKVEGTVLMPDGQPMKSGSLTLTRSEQAVPGFSFGGFRTGRTDAEGHFSFLGVTPGQYALLSRAGQPAGPPPAAATPISSFDMRTPPLWASSDVAVEGQNISGITLTLQPGLSVSGRVVVEPGTLPPPALNRVRISMAAVLNPGEMSLGSSAATADANGQFSIEGVTPGRYKLMASVAGQRPDAPGWVAKSAILDDQDTLDFPATLKRSLEGAAITLTDRTTELSGLVNDAAGQVAPEYFVIVFPADRQYWTQQSRRVQSVRPSANGRYQVRNLPPGDYLLVPLVDVEPGEWQDPSFLQRIAPNGIKVTLGEGEKKTQDIKVGGLAPIP